MCKNHGGSAPQVRAKAEERLRAMVTPALDNYDKILKMPPDQLVFAASRDILDRTGHKAPDKIDLHADIQSRTTVVALADVLSVEQLEELISRANRQTEETPEIAALAEQVDE